MNNETNQIENNNTQQEVQPLQPLSDLPVDTVTPQVENNDTPVHAANDTVTQQVQIQTELQNIPTVDQNKQQFMNNIQSINQEKNEEKKEGINFVFIIILFVVILAAIYFLFPILLNYI